LYFDINQESFDETIPFFEIYFEIYNMIVPLNLFYFFLFC